MSTFSLINYFLFRPAKLLSVMAILVCFFWDFARVSKKKVLLYSFLIWLTICVGDGVTNIYILHEQDWTVTYSAVYLAVCVATAFLLLRRVFLINRAVLLYALSVTLEYALFISSSALWVGLNRGALALYVINSGVILALGAVIGFLVRKAIAPLLRLCHDSKTWYVISIPPIMGSVGTFILYDMQGSSNISTVTHIAGYVLFAALMTANAVCAGSITKSVLAAEYKAKFESADELLTMQRERYTEMAMSVEQTKQARHDLRHQMSAMSGLLTAGKYDELKAYLNEYEAEAPQAAISTGNAVADAVIGHYFAKAHKENIDITYQISIPQNCGIEDTDLSVLMGNCLENAIEACRKLPEEERSIHITSLVQGAYFGLTFENSFDGTLYEKDGELLSIKRSGKKPGVGLSSVRQVAEKYNGSVEVEHTEKLFRVSLVLEYR